VDAHKGSEIKVIRAIKDHRAARNCNIARWGRHISLSLFFLFFSLFFFYWTGSVLNSPLNRGRGLGSTGRRWTGADETANKRGSRPEDERSGAAVRTEQQGPDQGSRAEKHMRPGRAGGRSRSIGIKPHEAKTGAADRDRSGSGATTSRGKRQSGPKSSEIGSGRGRPPADRTRGDDRDRSGRGSDRGSPAARGGSGGGRTRRRRAGAGGGCGDEKKKELNLLLWYHVRNRQVVFPGGQRPQHIVTCTCENMQETP
jgi:hypothetical protein